VPRERSVSSPRSSNGRADFPHPAFRPASSRGLRQRAKMHPAELQHTEFSKYRFRREAAHALRGHLMAPDQEPSDTVIDVVVDRPVGNAARAMTEVGRPTAQQAVQLGAYVRPRCLVAGN
jgi:hypothetical protein